MAQRLKIRLIAPDRPGYGYSTPHPGRTLSHWADDVAYLAENLQFKTYALAGFSGGAPHALACAALMPDKVTSLGLVCPLGPIADPDYKDTLSLSYRVSFNYMTRIPGLIPGIFAIGRFGFNHAPALVYGAFLARSSLTDWRVLMGSKVRQCIQTSMKEGFRPSLKGGLGDLEVFQKPWDLPLDNIKAPITLWQGLSDRNVPVQTSLRLGERLPNCTVHALHGTGHFWILNNYETVLTALSQATTRAQMHHSAHTSTDF